MMITTGESVIKMITISLGKKERKPAAMFEKKKRKKKNLYADFISAILLLPPSSLPPSPSPLFLKKKNYTIENCSFDVFLNFPI